MEAEEVLDLVAALHAAQVGYWLDGGWGVDCLLGRQTRPHSDLDLVVPREDLERAGTLLASRGYEVLRDWRPTSVAFRDGDGREVDLHPVDPTPDGGGVQVLPDGDHFRYGASAEGVVAGMVLRCVSAADQLRAHEGYPPRPVDHADIHQLVVAFGLQPPAPYA